MNQSEDTEVRQASRLVTAATRQAVAKEKARITANKARHPSALEQAAAEWQRGQKTTAIEPQEERLRIFRQVETCPLSFQQVFLPAGGIESPEDEVDWKPYSSGREKRTATTLTGRVNMAGVCALSRRLMAIERARAQGRKPVDLKAYALEQAGRRWIEERARQK